jgi:mevalonate kinase
MTTHTAVSPGKIILSGEHAVVYGAPAIVTAVDLPARATAKALDEPVLRLCSPAEAYEAIWTPEQALKELAAVRQRHVAFLEDQIPITEVLPKPEDLLPLAAAVVLERRPEPIGLQVELSFEMPFGSGMGSSAAGALAVQAAVGAACGVRRSRDEALADAMTTERWMHGRPSGVDPYVCLRGGTVAFDGGDTEFVPLSNRRLWLVHSGRPEATTGECVAAVRQDAHPASLWDAFAGVTGAIRDALERDDQEQLIAGVRANHRLLCEIGVVPERIRRFIEGLEDRGGAAKIAGAGSIRGDAGGMLWCVGSAMVADLAQSYDYTFFPAEGGAQGARVIDTNQRTG